MPKITVTINETDAFDDGWQGQYVRVFDSGGVEVAAHTLEAGGTGSDSFELATGTYAWTFGEGDFINESSFVMVRDDTGEVLAEAGGAAAGGSFTLSVGGKPKDPPPSGPVIPDSTPLGPGVFPAALEGLGLEAKDPLVAAIGAGLNAKLHITYGDAKALLSLSGSKDVITSLSAGYSAERATLVAALTEDGARSHHSYRTELAFSKVELGILALSAVANGEITTNDYQWLTQKRLPSPLNIQKVQKHLSDNYPGVPFGKIPFPKGDSPPTDSDRAAFYGLSNDEYADFLLLLKGRSAHIHGTGLKRDKKSVPTRTQPVLPTYTPVDKPVSADTFSLKMRNVMKRLGIAVTDSTTKEGLQEMFEGVLAAKAAPKTVAEPILPAFLLSHLERDKKPIFGPDLTCDFEYVDLEGYEAPVVKVTITNVGTVDSEGFDGFDWHAVWINMELVAPLLLIPEESTVAFEEAPYDAVVIPSLKAGESHVVAIDTSNWAHFAGGLAGGPAVTVTWAFVADDFDDTTELREDNNTIIGALRLALPEDFVFVDPEEGGGKKVPEDPRPHLPPPITDAINMVLGLSVAQLKIELESGNYDPLLQFLLMVEIIEKNRVTAITAITDRMALVGAFLPVKGGPILMGPGALK